MILPLIDFSQWNKNFSASWPMGDEWRVIGVWSVVGYQQCVLLAYSSFVVYSLIEALPLDLHPYCNMDSELYPIL